jgi:hypothetical protein
MPYKWVSTTSKTFVVCETWYFFFCGIFFETNKGIIRYDETRTTIILLLSYILAIRSAYVISYMPIKQSKITHTQKKNHYNS